MSRIGKTFKCANESCNNFFIAKTSTEKYCCAECAKEQKNRNRRAKRRQESGFTPHMSICAKCGRMFYKKFRGNKYCSVQCLTKATHENMAKKRAAAKEERAAKKAMEKEEKRREQQELKEIKKAEAKLNPKPKKIHHAQKKHVMNKKEFMTKISRDLFWYACSN